MSKTDLTRTVLWEAVAPVVRWPMRTPARLAGTTALVVALGMGAGQVSAAVERSRPPEPPAAADSAATHVLRAWLSRGGDAATWRGGFDDTATPAMRRAWEHVDPARIPVHEIGEVTPASVTPDRVVWIAETDAGRVQVVAVPDPKRADAWLIDSILPTQEETK